MADEPQSSAVPDDGRASIDVPPLPRLDFTDQEASGLKQTDRLLRLEDGTMTRERMVRSDARSENVMASGPAAPTSMTLAISHALVDDDGRVQRDDAGGVVLARVHELTLTNEALGRLGTPEAVQAAVDDARRIAAGLASQQFLGHRLAQALLADRGQS